MAMASSLPSGTKAAAVDGNKVAELRERPGWSQREPAVRAAIDPWRLRLIELEAAAVKYHESMRLCGALGVELEIMFRQLLGGAAVGSTSKTADHSDRPIGARQQQHTRLS